MSKVEILSAERHFDLTVDASIDPKFDDVRAMASVVANELPKLVLDYPVFITKNPESGQFELSALMGFSANENLFIQGGRWHAAYIPMDIRRHPFKALIVEVSDSDEAANEAGAVKVGINVESNRVSVGGQGQALFNADGGSSDFVNKASEILSALMSGMDLTKTFLNTLVENDLIESVQMSVSTEQGKKVSFEGLYTVHDEKLNALSSELVVQFHRSGYLQASHALIHSIGHMEKLIKWKECVTD